MTFCLSWKIAPSSSICSAEFLTSALEKVVAEPLVQSSCGICNDSSLAALRILHAHFTSSPCPHSRIFLSFSISHLLLHTQNQFRLDASTMSQSMSQSMSLFVQFVQGIDRFTMRRDTRASTQPLRAAMRRVREIAIEKKLRLCHTVFARIYHRMCTVRALGWCVEVLL